MEVTIVPNAALQGMADFDEVVVWALKGNELAIRFCERLGFRFDGNSQTLDRGGEATVLRMVLNRNPENG